MSYQVVGYPFCPYVQRVLITLNEKAIDFESIWLDPHAELPEWFKEWSPLGKVPVMKVTTGEVLFESMAIVEYIEELHKVPSIYAKLPAKRALQRAWASIAGELYGPQHLCMRAQTMAEVEAQNAVIYDKLAILETRCGRTYFSGETMTAVDVILAPFFIRQDVLLSLGAEDLLADFPKLQALSGKLLTHHAILQIIAGDWTAQFIALQKENGGILFQEA